MEPEIPGSIDDDEEMLFQIILLTCNINLLNKLIKPLVTHLSLIIIKHLVTTLSLQIKHLLTTLSLLKLPYLRN